MDFFDSLFAKLSNRKIFLYGADATCIRFLREAEKRSVSIQYLVDRDTKKQGLTLLGKRILNPYELMDENYEEASIVITAPVGKQSIVNTLLGMGFSLEENIILDYVDQGDYQSIYCNDLLLGISRGGKTIVEMRPRKRNDKTMLVLGGSTTDPYYNNIKSWPFFLQKLFDDNSLGIQVLNGGVIGYALAQELLLLLRDGIKIRPDYLVDYSGYNDFAPALNIDNEGKYEYVSRTAYLNSEGLIKEYVNHGKVFKETYYGEKTLDNIGMYLQNQSCIKALCDHFNIKYWSLLQPNLFSSGMPKDSWADRLCKEQIARPVLEAWSEFHAGYLRKKSNYPYIVDLSDIFEDASGIFDDYIHVSEKGNERIAEHVYSFVSERL